MDDIHAETSIEFPIITGGIFNGGQMVDQKTIQFNIFAEHLKYAYLEGPTLSQSMDIKHLEPIDGWGTYEVTIPDDFVWYDWSAFGYGDCIKLAVYSEAPTQVGVAVFCSP